MRVIGCDTSTRTGWVVQELQDGKIHKLGHGEIIVPKNYNEIKRLQYIGSKIESIACKYDTNVAVIEGYGYNNKYTLVPLVEIGTVVRLALAPNNLMIVVPPTTLKKFTSCSGAAKKDRMMLEVYKKWGFQGTDNEVDAFALTMFAFAITCIDTKSTKLNLEAVETWKMNNNARTKTNILLEINSIISKKNLTY